MFFVDVLKSLNSNVCNLSNCKSGVDYFIDFSESEQLAILTTDCSLQVGNEVILSRLGNILQYRVEAVDYYWDDSSIRTALLKLETEEEK